jgi:hypothetical protein
MLSPAFSGRQTVDEKIHGAIGPFPQCAVAGPRRRCDGRAGLKRSFADFHLVSKVAADRLPRFDVVVTFGLVG